MKTRGHQFSMLIVALCILLSASALCNAAVVHRDNVVDWQSEEDQDTWQRDCSVGQRSSVEEALNELFTCLLVTHVEPTDVYRLSRQIDFHGIAGSGVKQKPLLKGVYSVQGLRGDGESYRRYYDVSGIFTPELGQDEVRGSAELAKEDAYLNHLEGSPFVRDLHATLVANAFDVPTSLRNFVRHTLYDHWFKLYARTAKAHERGLRESSGFGHVFIGEVKTNDVTGFHSWLQLLQAEENGTFDYKGYVRLQGSSSVVLAGLQFSWLGRAKSLSSFMFGVPPDFELALYSACFVVNPGRKTSLAIKGRAVSVQTHYVNHQRESVATAYPIV